MCKSADVSKKGESYRPRGARVDPPLIPCTKPKKERARRIAFPLRVLLQYGADVASSDVRIRTPFVSNQHNINFIKEIAKLKFVNQPVSYGNLKFLDHEEKYQNFYRDCLDELKKMKDFKFYNSLSFFDILEMRKNHIKLIRLAKNEKFVAAFTSEKSQIFLQCYGNDLDEIFSKAHEKSMMLNYQEGIIFESGLDKQFLLPVVIVEKISYFACEKDLKKLN